MSNSVKSFDKYLKKGTCAIKFILEWSESNNLMNST